MPLAGAMAENATLFLVYNKSLNYLSPYFSNLTSISLAGAIAGAAASFILTPVELLKCRLQVQSMSIQQSTSTLSVKPPGPIKLFQDVLRQHGLKGLWLGQTGTLIRESGGSALWFGCFDVVSQYFLNRRKSSVDTSRKLTRSDLGSLELITAGASAGLVYNVSFFPADTVKSALQTEESLVESTSSSKQKGFVQKASEMYREKGIKGFYRGCGITIVRTVPSSALIFFTYVELERRFG
jgi:mitochondrial ornithine carrier protein